MPETKFYIAYGSNLNLPQMRRRCPTAKPVGTALIPNYRLLFKGSKTGSYLTIEKATGYSVPVAVWEVTPMDERNLDRYEGFPMFYYKKEMTLNVKNRVTGRTSKKTVFAYIMHEDHLIGVPSTGYIDTCIAGYHSFGFDPEYLMQALDYSWEVCTHENT